MFKDDCILTLFDCDRRYACSKYALGCCTYFSYYWHTVQCDWSMKDDSIMLASLTFAMYNRRSAGTIGRNLTQQRHGTEQMQLTRAREESENIGGSDAITMKMATNLNHLRLCARVRNESSGYDLFPIVCLLLYPLCAGLHLLLKTRPTVLITYDALFVGRVWAYMLVLLCVLVFVLFFFSRTLPSVHLLLVRLRRMLSMLVKYCIVISLPNKGPVNERILC